MTTYARRGGTYRRNGKTFVRKGVAGVSASAGRNARQHPVVWGLGAAGLTYGTAVSLWPLVVANPLLFAGIGVGLIGLSVFLGVRARRNARRPAKGKAKPKPKAKAPQPARKSTSSTWEAVNAAGNVVATIGTKAPLPVPAKVGVTALGLGLSRYGRAKADSTAPMAPVTSDRGVTRQRRQTTQPATPAKPIRRRATLEDSTSWKTGSDPVTPNQAAVLRRVGVDPTGLTKAEANDLIAKARRG